MRFTSSLVDNLLWAIISFGVLWLTFSLFAFLLPFVLTFLIIAMVIRYWRIRQLRNFFERSSSFKDSMKNEKFSRRSNIIDAEYEILDDKKH